VRTATQCRVTVQPFDAKVAPEGCTAKRHSRSLVLDLDATEHPIHGGQQGRFFHGYCGHDGYLPLHIFCGDFPLMARLRASNIEASDRAGGAPCCWRVPQPAEGPGRRSQSPQAFGP
jgi:hypothetical protein